MTRSFAVPRSLYLLLRSLSAAALVLLLFGAAAPSAQAQPQEDYWKTMVPAQINVLLEADDPVLQERGVDLVMQFHDRPDIAFDMSAVRSRLYRIFFDTNQSDDLRIMTLSALYVTDRKATNRVMIGWLMEHEASTRLRRHVQLALAQQG